jgi:hypothetical protein
VSPSRNHDVFDNSQTPMTITERIPESTARGPQGPGDSGVAKICRMGVRISWLSAILLLASAQASAKEESRKMLDPRAEQAIALMMGFAERTGLTTERPRKRYLWTDAFAVCNFLGLAQATGDERYTELALRLVDQVHHTLGQYRDDDARSGWISGLAEAEGEAHPTRGGLRIGKELPERGPNEVFDERLEWDRDGQYFHYLTKWMHALDQVARSTGRPRFNLWARELAEASHEAFTYSPAHARPRRMYWKMSIDLTRPLVPSMGKHDPLDGYISYVELRSSAAKLPDPLGGPDLEDETSQSAAMIEGGEWATADPLGIGGLLVDAYRAEQLMGQGAALDEGLVETLLTASLTGLQYYARSGELRLPAEHRLAFRELGLAIGLHAVELMWQAADHAPSRSSMGSGVRARLRSLMEYSPIRDEIESFWRPPGQRSGPRWNEHRDINEVMLATSLAPEGFLVLP